jgi:acyl carrier protein
METKLRSFILREISKLTGLPQERIDLTCPITQLGMSSLMLVELNFALKDQLNIEFPEDLLFSDKTSLNDIAHTLLKQDANCLDEAGK